MIDIPVNLRGFRDKVDGTVYRVGTAVDRFGAALYWEARLPATKRLLVPLYYDLQEDFDQEYPDAL